MWEAYQKTDGPQARWQVWALLISIGWMVACQVACVALWDVGWTTRQAALIHWLLIGVLPPALALWKLERISR